jgi:hypothetical protein
MRPLNYSLLISQAMREAALSARNDEVVLLKAVREECLISGNTVIIDFVRKDFALDSSAEANQ